MVASTAIAAVAAITSAYSAVYAGQQAEYSRHALSSAQKNEAFVIYLDRLDSVCKILNLGGGGGYASVTDTSDFKPEVHVWGKLTDLPTERINRALSDVDPAIVAFTKARARLSLWIEDRDEEGLNEITNKLVFAIRDVQRLPSGGASHETLIKLWAHCSALGEYAFRWYKVSEGSIFPKPPEFTDVVIKVTAE